MSHPSRVYPEMPSRLKGVPQALLAVALEASVWMTWKGSDEGADEEEKT